MDFDAAQKTVESLSAHRPRAVSRRSGRAAASATEAPKVRGGGPATREAPGAGAAGGCRPSGSGDWFIGFTGIAFCT